MQALLAKDPPLARAHFDYRKPLYFAVRENRLPDDPEWGTPLAWATRGGHDEIAKLLT